MYIFRSIHEIINTIFVAKGLLVEMFEKRKVHSFRYSDALTLLKEDENRLKILIEKEIIHQNGNFVELDTRFLGTAAGSKRGNQHCYRRGKHRVSARTDGLLPEGKDPVAQGKLCTQYQDYLSETGTCNDTEHYQSSTQY